MYVCMYVCVCVCVFDCLYGHLYLPSVCVCCDHFFFCAQGVFESESDMQAALTGLVTRRLLLVEGDVVVWMDKAALKKLLPVWWELHVLSCSCSTRISLPFYCGHRY